MISIHSQQESQDKGKSVYEGIQAIEVYKGMEGVEGYGLPGRLTSRVCSARGGLRGTWAETALVYVPAKAS